SPAWATARRTSQPARSGRKESRFTRELEDPVANKLKWLGHSSWQLTTSKGMVLLLDPWLNGNPVATMRIEDLPEAAYVLVTHDHRDHAGDAVAVTRHTGATLVGQPETVGRYKGDGVEDTI